MTELRIGAHETATRVGGNTIVIVPFAIEHITHLIAPFPSFSSSSKITPT